MLRDRPPALPWFCAILAATALWQVAYCSVVTSGRLTGLFFIGENMRWPPEPGAFVYRNSTGYDGQLYRIMANDPGLRGRGKLLYGPRFRYRRILVPAAAALAGAGRPAAIDIAYVALTDLILAFGGVCFVRLAAGLSPPALAAPLYVALPAVIASSDRMVLDGTALALCVAAWWFYTDRRFLAMWVAAACAVLTRETSALAVPGFVLAFCVRRDYRRGLLSATAVVPAAAWWMWLASRTEPTPQDGQWSIPLAPQIARLFHPRVRDVGAFENTVLQALDVVGLLCLLFAFAWIAAAALRELRARRLREDTALVLPMAAAATFFSAPSLLLTPYDFLRHASLPIAWVALRMLRTRPWLAAVYGGCSALPLLAYRVAALVRGGTYGG